jgi:hypothetical protein
MVCSESGRSEPTPASMIRRADVARVGGRAVRAGYEHQVATHGLSEVRRAGCALLHLGAGEVGQAHAGGRLRRPLLGPEQSNESGPDAAEGHR